MSDDVDVVHVGCDYGWGRVVVVEVCVGVVEGRVECESESRRSEWASHWYSSVCFECDGLIVVKSAGVGCLCCDPWSDVAFELWVVCLDGLDDGATM